VTGLAVLLEKLPAFIRALRHRSCYHRIDAEQRQSNAEDETSHPGME
jgi:hypothetical protein